MTLTEIKEKIIAWPKDSKSRNNEPIDILIAIIDYLIEKEKTNG